MVNSSDLDRKKYLINMSDAVNSNAKRGLYDALDVIREIYEHNITVLGYKNGLTEEYDKQIAAGKIKSSDAQKAKKKKEKKFRKVRTSFNIALSESIKLTKSITEIDEILQTLDVIVSLKQNENNTKESQELISESQKLKSALSSYRKKIEKQAIKMVKQLEKASHRLNGYNSKVAAHEQLKSIEKNFASEILKDASSVSSLLDKSNLKEKMEAANKKTEEVYELKEASADENINKLFDKLTKIELESISLEDKQLKSDIKEETKSIRRAVKPKTMSITKENLEKLKKSEQLKQDIEMIQSAIQFKYILPLSKFGNKFKGKIENIKKQINKIVEIENAKQVELGREQSHIEDNVRFANEAATAYQTVISDSKEQQNIASNTHIRNEEIKEEAIDLGIELANLKEQHGKEYTTHTDTVGGDVYERKATYDKSKEIKETKEKMEEKYEQIESNNEKMKEVQKKKISIPERYRNMKQKLQEKSKLRKAVTSNYEIGGMHL